MLMTDPREGYPPMDLELLKLLRESIKLEPISPPSSPAYFFQDPMPRFKSTPNRPSQPINKRPTDNRGRHRANSVGVHRNKPPPHRLETNLLW